MALTELPPGSEKPSIVISGASGFVGRHLAVRAAELHPPAQLTCYVTRSDSAYESQGKKALASRNIPQIETDLTTGSGLIDPPQQPSVIFHLAANSATWSKDHSCNDRGTQNLISSLRHVGPGTHVVFTSTIAVMDTRKDYSTPVTEVTPTCRPPFTDYGSSKLRAEEWLRQEAKNRGFALTILRPVTVYGPECRPNTVFNVLKHQALKRSTLARIQWPGKTGFVHVDDLVEAMLSLSKQPPPSGTTEVFLVQAETRSLGDLNRLIHARLDIPFRPLEFSERTWRLVRNLCCLMLRLKWCIPTATYAAWWRLRIACKNVFWCDTAKLRRVLPEWKPSVIENRIEHCL